MYSVISNNLQSAMLWDIMNTGHEHYLFLVNKFHRLTMIRKVKCICGNQEFGSLLVYKLHFKKSAIKIIENLSL